MKIKGIEKVQKSKKNFIGIKLLQNVEKMMMVEVIIGKKKYEKELEVEIDYVSEIKKKKIVVKDKRGL